MVTSSRDFTTYTSCKACGNTTKTEHGECATCGALKPTSPAPAPEVEIARLHAELANAKLERDNIASLNSSLIAELAEARRALLAGNDTVLANKKLQEDNAANDRIIANLNERSAQYEREAKTLRERIATYWQPMAEAWQRDAGTLRKRVAELEEDYMCRHNDAVGNFEKWKLAKVRAERAEARVAELESLRPSVAEIERDEAIARAERAEEQAHYANGVADLAMKHRISAEAELKAMREVLSFYADERNWHTAPHYYSAAVRDCGTKARAARNQSQGGER